MSTRTIDDHDPSISYSSGWGPAGGPNEYDGTTMGTNAEGSSATLRFSGVGVSVFGTITNSGLGSTPHSTYTIDNGAPTTYTGIQQSTIQYKVQFFQSPTLAPGEHTLVVSLASGNDSIFYLDYFEIIPSPTVFVPPAMSMSLGGVGSASVIGSSSSGLTTSSSVVGSGSSSSISSSSGATTTSTRVSQGASISGALPATVTVTESHDGVGASASNIPSSSSSTSTSSQQPIGPIIGGVLGGLLILLFAILAILLLRRRNRPQLLLHLQNADNANGEHYFLESAVCLLNLDQSPLAGASTTRQVTPFNHPVPSSGGNTSAQSQPQSESPGTHWQSSKFPPLMDNHLAQPGAPSSDSEASSSTYPAVPDERASTVLNNSLSYQFRPCSEKVPPPRVMSSISSAPSTGGLLNGDENDPPPSYCDS